MSRLGRAIALVVAALLSRHVAAHEITMAEMELRETRPGEFVWQWVATGNDELGAGLTPLWPEGCAGDGSILRCGEGGLAGTLGVEGVGETYSAAVVKIHWLDGQATIHTLTSAQPETRLFGSADDRRTFGEIAAAYTMLGVEHILSGFDHLLFVLALLFLVGFDRRLVLTITAFTLAHSLTLALSALGLIALRPLPVEATIALSIALVAGEALHRERTLARRWPAIVAFLFGLVHGLGFAGALKEIGLPQDHLPAALLTFNLGVELGQLLVVSAVYVAYRAIAGRPELVLARVPALYVIGGIAVYWSIGRIASLAA